MSTQERLEALEIKASYTEDLLEQLNLTIYRQQIDGLLRAVTELRQQRPRAAPAHAACATSCRRITDFEENWPD
jgi:SlyX protein